MKEVENQKFIGEIGWAESSKSWCRRFFSMSMGINMSVSHLMGMIVSANKNVSASLSVSGRMLVEDTCHCSHPFRSLGPLGRP